MRRRIAKSIFELGSWPSSREAKHGSGSRIRREEAGQDGGGLLPILRFLAKLFMAGTSEFVEFGAAVVVGLAPLGGDVTFLVEFEKRGINGAVVDGETIAAGLFNAASDTVAVERAEGFAGFEN